MFKIYLTSFLFFLLSCCLPIYGNGVYSGEKSSPSAGPDKYITENGHRVTINSKILNEEKEIYIGLPENFNDSTRYPLVLVLEGEILFETIAPMTRLAATVGEIPECVVVGIPLNNRHLDYAPKLSSHPESGHADTMLEFFRSELFPFLELEYHCSETRIIWAHSGLAGIFCTYVLIGEDSQFSGIISSSPNLRFMQADYLSKEDAFENISRKGKLFYYLSFGSAEAESYMGKMYNQVKELAARLEAEAPENLTWKYQMNENKTHFSNAIVTYMDGLMHYFRHMK